MRGRQGEEHGDRGVGRRSAGDQHVAGQQRRPRLLGDDGAVEAFGQVHRVRSAAGQKPGGEDQAEPDAAPGVLTVLRSPFPIPI